MIWIASVAAIFLFYVLVRRDHKLLSIKLLGLVSLSFILLVAGIVTILLLQERSKQKRNEHIRIVFSGSRLLLNTPDRAASTVLSFTVCNEESVDLLKYGFSASGFEEGRSTPRILTETGYGDSTPFSSDVIIRAKECSQIEWTGRYITYPQYGFSGVYGTWSNDAEESRTQWIALIAYSLIVLLGSAVLIWKKISSLPPSTPAPVEISANDSAAKLAAPNVTGELASALSYLKAPLWCLNLLVVLGLVGLSVVAIFATPWWPSYWPSVSDRALETLQYLVAEGPKAATAEQFRFLNDQITRGCPNCRVWTTDYASLASAKATLTIISNPSNVYRYVFGLAITKTCYLFILALTLFLLYGAWKAKEFGTKFYLVILFGSLPLITFLLGVAVDFVDLESFATSFPINSASTWVFVSTFVAMVLLWPVAVVLGTRINKEVPSFDTQASGKVLVTWPMVGSIFLLWAWLLVSCGFAAVLPINWLANLGRHPARHEVLGSLSSAAIANWYITAPGAVLLLIGVIAAIRDDLKKKREASTKAATTTSKRSSRSSLSELKQNVLEVIFGEKANPKDFKEFGVTGRSLQLFAAAKDNLVAFLSNSTPSELASVRDVNNFTLLHVAANYASYDAVEYLLSVGCDPNVSGGKFGDWKPLHSAAFKCSSKLIKTLVSHGARLEDIDEQGFTPLTAAACFGNVDAIRELCRSGANVEHRDHLDRTPLNLASAQGKLEAVKALIENGSKVDVKDKEGALPIFQALSKGHLDIVWHLVNSGASLTAVDPHGSTVLHWLGQFFDSKLAEAAINAGCEVDLRNVFGRTALHMAHFYENERYIKLLIQSGADPKLGDKDGLLPEQYRNPVDPDLVTGKVLFFNNIIKSQLPNGQIAATDLLELMKALSGNRFGVEVSGDKPTREADEHHISSEERIDICRSILKKYQINPGASP